MLQNSRAHGPVSVSKYSGQFSGPETDLEIWPIKNADGTGMENLVEISFKTNSYDEASAKRTELMNLLDSKGQSCRRRRLTPV